MKTPNKTIAYACDQKVCDYCTYPLCRHTTDIQHAKNFEELEEGKYFEKENDHYARFAQEVISMLMLFCDDDDQISIKKRELEVNMKSILEEYV